MTLVAKLKYRNITEMKMEIRWEKIEKKLSAKGYKVGIIRNILRHSISKGSKRITSLKINGSLGEIKLRSDLFRNIVGPDIIRSTNFKMRLADGKLFLDGLGWGHGVGMCQSGAEKLAKRDWKYKKILKYYYLTILHIGNIR